MKLNINQQSDCISQGPRILVVDDEQAFLDGTRRELLASGFTQLQLEADPRKAIERFGQEEIVDIALIDIMMPMINGMELLKVIQRISPNTECLMITAVNEVKIAVECLKKGACDYLVKPIPREDLVRAIHHALRRAHRKKVMSASESSEAFEPLGSLAEVKKEHILRVYEATGRNKVRTARLLGIGLNTLRRKLESYGEK